MQRVLTSDEMKLCDEITISEYNIPGLLLMENAGRGAVEVIKQKFTNLESKRVLIVCGKGNNGGDGFVVARLLANCTAKVDVLLLAKPAELKGDAKTNFVILNKLAKKSSGKTSIHKYSKDKLNKFSEYDIIIDAIFGTGFSGAVKKPISEVVEWMNTCRLPIVAVDIPSGVNGTTGIVENCSVSATFTVTFGNLKSGLLCNAGRERSGEVYVADIGIPRPVSEDKRFQTFLVQQSDVQKALPKRSVFSHKYSVGKVFVLAGSNGLTGAAAMCCTSAMRIGAGAVILGTPESVYNILAKKLTETMVFPLPATSEGTLNLKAIDKIQEKLIWADVLVVGPGLSQNPETQELIIKVISKYKGNLVIDADGLNAIAVNKSKKFDLLKSDVIITPHVGEFSRLTNISTSEIERERISVVRRIANLFRATVVLKGVPTVTASKDGKVFLNSTGNAGMATAGAGDILTGIIAGLWAQGMEAVNSAWSGAFIHGLSGDLAASKLGEKSLVASDLIEFLPQALMNIEAGVIK